MPTFMYRGKSFYNPVEFALDQIGGTWKMPILWRLREKTLRYSEIRDDIPHISEKMLSTQLKELLEDGFIEKEIYPEVPPRTEYSLTPKGRRAIEVITMIRDYGLELMRDCGIDG